MIKVSITVDSEYPVFKVYESVEHGFPVIVLEEQQLKDYKRITEEYNKMQKELYKKYYDIKEGL